MFKQACILIFNDVNHKSQDHIITDKYNKECADMNQRRAKQIAASPVMADVTYEGMPVYIESVNDIQGTASVHPLDMPGVRQEVSLTDLVER